MHFQTRPAPPTVAAAVRELWLLDDDGGFHAGLPKPYVELVISLAGIHSWRAARGAGDHRYVASWVTPIQDGPRYARAVGRRRLIGARLEPWAAVEMFGPLPPGDGTPPPSLTRLLGTEARRLRARLLAAPDDARRLAMLATWLEAQPALRRAAGARLIPERHGTRAGELAAALRTSPRTLRRRFAAEAGVSPKRWLTLRRFDAVLRDSGLANPGRSFADLASAHGYADQSHLAREMARLAGATPGMLRRRPADGPPHLLPRS